MSLPTELGWYWGFTAPPVKWYTTSACVHQPWTWAVALELRPEGWFYVTGDRVPPLTGFVGSARMTEEEAARMVAAKEHRENPYSWP